MEQNQPVKAAAVIVAHPDDETLWAGGTILRQSTWDWFVITLCRASDPDRAPKFYDALQVLGARGRMADLDDGPEQLPLSEAEIEETVLNLIPQRHFDLLVTHNPAGEYTRHRRHEETGRTIIKLWDHGGLSANELWTFAYEDGGKQYLPRPIKAAHIYRALPDTIWQKKYQIITETYGFQKGGFEASTTPLAEAFWQFTDSTKAQHWLEHKVFQHESSAVI